jgi:uncharacterized protein (DUF488 family)
MPSRTTARVRPTHISFFTIGYQFHSLDSLIHSLNAHGVEILMDIRQNPVSRKAGFSKGPLQNALVQAGIEYRHNPELGTPLRIREMYRKPGDLPSVLAAYEKHISADPRAIKSLAEIAAVRTVCLLCLEKDPNMCHRGVIARKLYEMTKWKAIHLT